TAGHLPSPRRSADSPLTDGPRRQPISICAARTPSHPNSGSQSPPRPIGAGRPKKSPKRQTLSVLRSYILIERKASLMVENGKSAPDFDLPADDGEIVKLSALKGRPVVLYFYPKDDTSGCTAEAKGFSCLIDQFRDAGAEVIGISPDSVKS